jgi:hypothetical protein
MADPIDPQFLTAPERAEYRELQVLSGQVGAVGAPILVALVWGVISVGLFRLAVHWDVDYPEFANTFVRPLAVIAIALGALFSNMKLQEGLDVLRKKRDKEIASYRIRIGYDQRVLRQENTGLGDTQASDNRPHYWMTGVYDPERYYSYTKQQRDYMRLMDIDADAYDANVEGRE